MVRVRQARPVPRRSQAARALPLLFYRWDSWSRATRQPSIQPMMVLSSTSMDKVRSMDLLPHQAAADERHRPRHQARTRDGHATMYEGSEVTAVSDARPQPTSSGNGFDLNFENTPVATVAKVVLGDILGVGYTIDPRVQGNRQPCLGAPGAEVRHCLRARERLAVKRRGADPRHGGISPDFRSTTPSAPAMSTRRVKIQSRATAFRSCRCNMCRRRHCSS